MYFANAGIEISPILPVAAAFGISLVCSPAGISGAFLLLPFQVSVLGYTQPGVSATNHLFNILACPAGVIRFAKEGRLILPLALLMALGTLPGVFAGAILRITWFARAGRFQFFVALVLLYLAIRLLHTEWRGKESHAQNNSIRQKRAAPGMDTTLNQATAFQNKKNTAVSQPGKRQTSPGAMTAKCENARWSSRGVDFTYQGEDFHAPCAGIILLSLLVGLVGGIYGIGGGAIMAPFLVSFFGLPVHALAGACLCTTFLTSVAGVSFFSILALAGQAPWAAPDWGLGLLFGLGGMCGMYCGAALQKYIPARMLRYFLVLMLLGLGARYLF